MNSAAVDKLRCPLCKSEMHQSLRSILCLNNHNFDFSKKGYLNFLIKKPAGEYEKEALTARKKVIGQGFFDLLLEEVAGIINIKTNTPLNILDAGCGEGSQLDRIVKLLDKSAETTATGIDIAKEGIKMAAADYKTYNWYVADIANLPFRNNLFQVILNILSPSNYAEFRRVLGKAGLLIKVIPGNNYLHELREIFYEDTASSLYSNEKIITHFYNNFKDVEKKLLSYNFSTDKNMLENIIKMSPLTWRATDTQLKRVLDANIKSITTEFVILTARVTEP